MNFLYNVRNLVKGALTEAGMERFSEIQGSYIVYSNGEKKKVKNLGWLLKNWKNVDHFEILEHGLKSGRWARSGFSSDAVLVAKMRNGFIKERGIEYYVTEFASNKVLFKWLGRSIFKGVRVVVGSKGMKIGDKQWGEEKDKVNK